MKKLIIGVTLAAASLLLAACGGGSNDSIVGGGGGNANTNFTSFVKNLVKQPANGSPVSTNNRNFNNFGTGKANAFAGVNFGAVADPPGTSLATTACSGISTCKPGIHGPQQ